MSDLVETGAIEEDYGDEQMKKEKMPHFDENIKKWAVNTLAMMPLKTATQVFLVTYTSYNNPKYGTPEEIFRKIYNRFDNMRSNKDRPYRAMIQELRDTIESNLLDSFPLANLLIQLAEIHSDYYCKELTISQRIRLRAEVRKIVDKITSIKGVSGAQAGGWRGSNAKFPPKDKQIPFGQNEHRISRKSQKH